MKIVIVSIAVLALLFVFIRFLEYKSLYYPIRSIEHTPHDIALEYEEVNLATGDGVNISGWFVPAESPQATFILAHGNGGNISHRLEKIKILHGLNLNVFIFDYRGYGKSSGSPSEEGFYEDARACYEYLVNVKKIPANEIVGYGESLGGAVIIELALNNEVGGIIIESSFTSVSDMGRTIFPFIPAAIYKTKFDSLSKMKNIRVPALIFHSQDDEIVPFKFGKKLYEAAPASKEFIELRGGHNDAFLVSEKVFTEGIELFLSRLYGLSHRGI